MNFHTAPDYVLHKDRMYYKESLCPITNDVVYRHDGGREGYKLILLINPEAYEHQLWRFNRGS